MTRGVRAIERGDVIEQRGFAVDCFGDFIFGIAAEDDVVFVVHGDDGCGANFEMGDGRIGASVSDGVIVGSVVPEGLMSVRLPPGSRCEGWLGSAAKAFALRSADCLVSIC